MPVLDCHEPALSHHVNQGESWLDQSDKGRKTAALSYAALEFRYAIERLAVQYWITLLKRPLEETDLEKISTYKRLEGRLYDLAGHQRQIDGHFAFMRAVCQVAKIPAQLPTPNLGLLSKHWHSCSELCHVAWPLGSSAESYQDAMFSMLGQVLITLRPLVQSQLVGWPIIHEPTFAKLRDDFVAGRATIDSIRQHAERHGLWAQVVDKHGKPQHFIGEAINPQPIDGSA